MYPVPTGKWIQIHPCSCLDPVTHSLDCTGRSGLRTIPPGEYERDWNHNPLDKLWRELDNAVDHLMSVKRPSNLEKGKALGIAMAISFLLNVDVSVIRKQSMIRWRDRKGKKNAPRK